MLCNRSINWAVDRNLITTEDLGTNSSTSVVKEVLIGGGGEKVVEWRTRTCTICLPHRLGNSFQKISLF